MSARYRPSGDSTGVSKRAEFVGREAERRKRVVGVLAGEWWRCWHRCWCAAEARSRRWLGDPFDVDEGGALGVVRMMRRFTPVEDWRITDVGVLHDLGPFVTRLGLKDRSNFDLERWLLFAIVLAR